MSATLQAPAPRRRTIIPRTRRGRVGLGLALILAVPAVAWALYLVFATITGTVTANTVEVRWITNNATEVGESMACDWTVTAGGDLDVTAAGFPNSECGYIGVLEPAAGNSEDAVFVGFEEGADMPSGWTFEPITGGELSSPQDTPACGTPLSAFSQSVPGTYFLPVKLVTDDAPGSGSFADPAAGARFVPASQYTPTLCTP